MVHNVLRDLEEPRNRLHRIVPQVLLLAIQAHGFLREVENFEEEGCVKEQESTVMDI